VPDRVSTFAASLDERLIVPDVVAPAVVPVVSRAIVVLWVSTGIAADVPPMNVNVPVVPNVGEPDQLEPALKFVPEAFVVTHVARWAHAEPGTMAAKHAASTATTHPPRRFAEAPNRATGPRGPVMQRAT
jgi:hypothetical protein